MSEGPTTDPITVDDLHYIYLPTFGSEKIYVPQSAEEFKVLRSAGLGYYMYMANEKVEEVNGHTTVITRSPQIFEVRSSMIYESITKVSEKDLDLVDSYSNAYFMLPKIPWQMICEIDYFFREAHRRHGTEAIVLLTYDEAKEGADGWGFLVPDQENTAGDCNYKPESVAGKYPDTASIVGSWHSHPMMSAYASGTDHKDQASFDGLHLTSGWTSDITEYYAEMQVGSMNWKFNTDIILASAPPAEVSEDVKGLVDKVQKKTYGGSSTGGSSYGSGSRSTGSMAPTGSSVTRSARLEPVIGLPKDAPKATEVTYIGRMKAVAETECPFCHTPIISIDLEWRMCSACHCFLALPGESLSDVLDHRKNLSLMTWDIDIAENPEKPIAIWERDVEDDKITTVYEPGELVKS